MSTQVVRVWDNNAQEWVEVGAPSSLAQSIREIVITEPGTTFTVRKAPANPGEYEIPADCNSVEILLVGGGGGGGANSSSTRAVLCCAITTYNRSGGGGAGEVIHQVFDVSGISSFTVTVGAGGAGSSGTAINNADGTNSVISYGSNPVNYITAIGGGRGGSYPGSSIATVGNGGSAGGINYSGTDDAGIPGRGGAGAGGSNVSYPQQVMLLETFDSAQLVQRSSSAVGLGQPSYAPVGLGSGSTSRIMGAQGGRGVVIFGRQIAGGGPGAHGNATGVYRELPIQSQFGAPASVLANTPTPGGNATPNTGAGGGASGREGVASGNGASGICVIRYFD